jgi:hypothetical protein
MKNVFRNLSLFFAVWLGALMTHAQTSSSLPTLELSAPDSIFYSVFLDSQSKIEMVKGSQSFTPNKIGDRLIDVILHIEPMVHLRTTVRIDSLEVTKVRIVANATSYTLVKEGNISPPVDYTKPTSEGASSNNLVVEVNIGQAMRCAPPAAPELVQASLNEIAALDFEREKLKLLQKFFASSCFTVQQIEALVSSIEDEQRRFDLLQVAFGSCFNQHAYDQLLRLLYLERNQAAFVEWLQVERDSQAISSGE